MYDARWEAEEFDESAVRRLFEATLLYAREIGVDTLTLARDARLAAPGVMQIAAETALAGGMRVFLCADPISTPHSYYLTARVTQEYPATMGLTITASHNPASYIGVKFVVPPVQAIGQDCGPRGGLTRIRELYHSPAAMPATAGGRLELVDFTDDYIAFSIRQAGLGPGDLEGLGVVLDGFHGSAGPEAYRALQTCGAGVIARRLIPDGRFPTGSPNPTSRNKMDPAVREAGEMNYQVVIGLDGDGDRIVFGDRRGILSAGFVAIPVLRACGLDGRQKDRPVVLYDPKVNPLALQEWGRLGTRPVLFRNGHSQIKDYMRCVGAVAAAEESGHYYHRMKVGSLTVCCENSLLTVLLFLGAVGRDAGLMDGLWNLQKGVAVTGEFNYQFTDDATRDAAMAAVLNELVADGAETRQTTADGIDLQGTVVQRGVRIDEGGVHLTADWYSGYLRVATNEKSVVRSYFSAADLDACRAIEQRTRRILGERFHGWVID